MTTINKSTRILLCCIALLFSFSGCNGFSLPARSICQSYPSSSSSINRGPRQRLNLALWLSSRGHESDYDEGNGLDLPLEAQEDEASAVSTFWNDLSNQLYTKQRLPPIQVDDFNLLFYDVFLLVNLSVSISFWVVHRLQLDYIALAFNEGCLLSILWIVAGLYHGIFLESAVDGHQRPYYINGDNGDDANEPKMEQDLKENATTNNNWWKTLTKTSNQGGPSAAGLLALNTFINTISLRLIVALVVAIVEHRQVFDDSLEQLIPLEVGFGLVLMSAWRTIHSMYAPRI